MSRITFHRWLRTGFLQGALAAGLSALVGCGDGRATVDGTVTFDGEPVQDGRIVFEPVDGQGSTAGGKITAGHYHLAGEAGVKPGRQRVSITATRRTGRQVEAGPPSPPGTKVDEIERYIPRDYNRETTLTCEVTSGRNQHDFALKSPSNPAGN